MKKIIVSIIIIGLLLTIPETSESAGTKQDQLVEQFTPKNAVDDTSSQLFDSFEFIPKEVILKFTDETSISLTRSPKGIVITGIESVDQLNEMYEVAHAEKLLEDDSIPSLANVYKFIVADNSYVRSAVESYINDSNVEIARPNCLWHTCAEQGDKSAYQKAPTIPGYYMPNDPYFYMQWALHNTGQTGGTPDADIDAPEAWNIEKGDKDIVIAILDTGVDFTNPDMGNYTKGIIELKYTIESPHPLDYYNEVFDFSEIFPQYDFDAVSFHFSKIDIGKWRSNARELVIYTEYPVLSRNMQIVFDYTDYRYYNGTITDVWTPFTERNKNVRIVANSDGHWGFKIDKVRLAKWVESSQISDKFVDGYDFVYKDPYPIDDVGHGTHCAGIAAAVTDNNAGIAGVAPNCKIMPVRVGDRWGINPFDVARAIVFAANKGADIISMSFGGPEDPFVNLAIDYAYNRGVVLVAAVGNDNVCFKKSCFPASYDKVISVSATDYNDNKASFSNHGSWIDVAAPGWDILSLRAHGTDMYLGSPNYTPGEAFVPAYDHNAILYRCYGTSMSCPHVAGIVGLILSKNSDLTNRETRTILHSSTDSVNYDKLIGIGRINAYYAVKKATHVVTEIKSPSDYKSVSGVISVNGTAKGDQFIKFSVEYGQGLYPTSWNQIGTVYNSLNDGILVNWNTENEEDGVYSIRLKMTAGDFTYEDRTLIIIDNIPETYFVKADSPSGGDGSPDTPFNKIEYAVDIAGASDTIYVYSGTYYEEIIIDEGRKITLIGEGKDNTIIDSRDRYYGTVKIFESSLVIKEFTIKPWLEYVDVEAYFSSFCDIFKNKMMGGKFLFAEGCNNIISDNIFRDNGIILFGEMYDSHDNIISGNALNDGIIEIDYTKDTLISGNTVGYIKLYGTKQSKVQGNKVVNGGISLDTGYTGGLCTYNTISGNIISHSKDCGILIQDSWYNEIIDNIISNQSCPGINLHALDESRSNLKYGRCKFNKVINNQISNTTIGIYLSAKLEHHGLNEGICKHNTLCNNDLSNNNNGILLEGACKNTIYGNTISNNKQYGINLTAARNGAHAPQSSDRNKIYHNNLISNGNQQGGGNAFDECDNIWYNPIKLKGNYWDDYKKKYPAANPLPLRPGIWDTPYDIPGGYPPNQDLYPLVKEYTGYIDLTTGESSTSSQQSHSQSSQQHQGGSSGNNY